MATVQAAKIQRTIVVCGIPDGLLEDDVMADILKIHFQKSKNKGGDVEDLAYPTPTKGVAYITFEDRQVAESVLAKGEHRLQDKRLHVVFTLKVSSYGESVFTCVSCLLDLSILREKYTLEDLVEDLKKNFTDLSFGTLHSDGQITVQGPFSAISSLQKKLALKIHNSVSKLDVKPGRRERTAEHRPTRPAKNALSLGVSNNFVQSIQKEGSIVVLDTDIYLYMKKFKEKLYQESLQKCGVISHEFRDGEVTTIYLNNPTNQSLGLLERAKSIVEDLAADLQSCLRKERLPLKGSSRLEKRKYVQACETINSRYPHVLVLPYSTYIDIVGTSSDIYEFSQQVNKTVGHFSKEHWR